MQKKEFENAEDIKIIIKQFVEIPKMPLVSVLISGRTAWESVQPQKGFHSFLSTKGR